MMSSWHLRSLAAHGQGHRRRHRPDARFGRLWHDVTASGAAAPASSQSTGSGSGGYGY
jgi:hypothetical protein